MNGPPGARRLRRLPALAGLLLAATAAVAAEPLPDAGRLLGWVRDLSAPAMEGRAAGTAGADRAAAYIAEHFRQIGLKPGGDGGTYFQRFTVLTRVRLGSDNRLDASAPGAAPREFTAGPDFLPFTFSEDGDVSGAVVFAGFGITAPPLGYDDYAGLDVRGKVVLVMTGEPQELNPQGPFRAAEHFHYTELRHKVLNAREHGAAAVVVVESPQRLQDAPRPIRGTTPAWGLVAVSATRAVAEALLAPAGLTLATLQGEIDRGLVPRSRALPGMTVRVRVALVREEGSTANVVGMLPGTDLALRGEAVVIGAHYDHLGRGSPFSLAPDHLDDIHPGADDNASGTAAVMGLAEAFVRSGGTRRTLVFVAFSGEEVGLLGSTHYVRQPPLPIEQTVAMVNFDMVGRMKDGQLYVMGVDTGQGLRALIEQAAGLDVKLSLRGDGVGPSDHTAFVNRDRPVVFFFTGTHGDYHRPGDTVDKIDADGLRKVAAVASNAVRALADRDARLAFVRVAPTAAPSSGRSGGYGPYFGSVPDFGESPAPGVRLSGVRPGSPADRSGLQPGDVIVRFAGVAVRTLDDLTFALRSRRPGETIEVRYLRDGAEHSVETTLEARR